MDMPAPAVLTLDARQLGRLFPFYLELDAELRLRALGPSLRKLMPGPRLGDACAAHFETSQPAGAQTLAQWRASVGELVILRSRADPGVVLRGTVEPAGGQGLFLLVTAVISGFDDLRQRGLGLRDFALHDSLAEVLRTAHGAQPDTGALERLVEQLRAIVEMGNNGVLYATRTGEVLHVNHMLCQMFGIDESRIAGLTVETFERHLGGLLAEEEPEHQPLSALLDAALEQAGAGADQRHVRTLRLVSPRHVTLQMSLALTPTRDLVFYFRDVTTETEVARMKSEFLSTAAHELRTPLASIYGFTELMLTRQMAPGQQREVLGTMHRQAQLLVNLINELLDLSRIESRQGKDFHRRLCRVSAIVDQTLKGMLVENDTRQVRLRLPHGAECIMVDPEKTQQALLNVLSNAYKYSPLGGDIELETVLRSRGGERQVGIRVRDHGMGMTAEQLARVFERFWRADPGGPIRGTGLGMSLVKEIVELQDGQVQVESMPQQGTTVTLWFPLTADFALSRPSDIQSEFGTSSAGGL